MHVYRITLEKHSKSLIASGNAGRWNSKDTKMIYTASSRSLACLENVVHRSALGLQQSFRTMIIQVSDRISITLIPKISLPKNWQSFENYPITQALGDEWIRKGETAILQVPSAIIAEEYNYLLNPAHENYKEVKMIRTEMFEFDQRIKNK